jgi:hypothetical protein
MIAISYSTVVSQLCQIGLHNASLCFPMRPRKYQDKRLSAIRFNDDNGANRIYQLKMDHRLDRIGNRRSRFRYIIPQPILIPVPVNPIPNDILVHTDPMVDKSEDSTFLTEFMEDFDFDFDNQFESFQQ